MNKLTTALSACAAALCLTAADAQAQTSAADSVYQHAKGNRLSIGGYGEVALTRNFYSDNVYRYRNPSTYKDDPGHGRFDVPHAVIYISYDFGKGWSMSSEIEFEHGGAGGAVEKEWEEEILSKDRLNISILSTDSKQYVGNILLRYLEKNSFQCG